MSDDYAMKKGPEIVQEMLDDNTKVTWTRDLRETREWLLARYARELELRVRKLETVAEAARRPGEPGAFDALMAALDALDKEVQTCQACGWSWENKPGMTRFVCNTCRRRICRECSLHFRWNWQLWRHERKAHGWS